MVENVIRLTSRATRVRQPIRERLLMPLRLIHAGRAAAVMVAFACVLASTGLAQTDRPRSNGELAAAVEQLKSSLDAVETAARDARTDRALAELLPRIVPLRDELRRNIEALAPRLALVDTRLKQIGEPPAATAPPEDPALAAERARLAAERSELDTALKQARLLAVRVDQLGERINEHRRTLLTVRLLARSPGLLDPAFWRETAAGLTAEAAAVGNLLRTSWVSARDKIGTVGLAAAALVVAGFAAAVMLLTRAWRRHLLARPAETRFARALAAVIALMSITLIAPAVVIVAVLAFESLGVIAAPLSSIGYGIAAAIAVARFGRGAALALFAPGEPARWLVGFHDEEAREFAEHLSWAARLVGVAVLCNVVFRATAAPVALAVAVSALMSLAIAGVAGHLLAWFPRREEGMRLPGLRVVLWLFVITVVVALAAGYIGFSAFVAGRFVAALAMLCALYVVLVFIDALFTEELTGNTAAGRAIAAAFGITPRGLELAGTLLSAALRIVVVLIALPPVLGPWGLFATDLVEFLQQAASGVRVAGITISLAAILTAFVWLVAGVLVARGAQRWLKTRFMPRTGIDPGLQHSVATLIGWALLIAAIALALSHLGIEPQQIALVAGALSVGIGFGLQAVVSNFICGIILLAERPIRVGDWVVVKSEEGIVRRISVRATEIETFDRASVIIPNSEFITGAVKNLTHSDTMGRVTVKVRAAYDCDVDAVRDILIACASEHPQVLQTLPPRVYLIAFGDIGLDLELRFIVANVNYGLTVKSDLQMTILRRFRAAGIKIPVMPHDEPVPGGVSKSASGPPGA
jgi:small-conductance mechanosensitive channel